MPKSTIYLPDVNIWLALVSKRHSHNSKAVQWFTSVDESSLAFCRITQMGLLRLLTNVKVMGPDVLSQARAWKVYNDMMQDSHLRFLNEPSAFEESWRSLTQRSHPSNHNWTDAYLLAFAKTAGLTFVTLDQSLQSFTETPIVVLV